jgi:hypothetical protein
MLLATSLATLSILIAIADHQLIYKPLLQLITPPGQTRTQQFERLHSASRYVNQLHVGLAAIAGILICLPKTYPNSRCD